MASNWARPRGRRESAKCRATSCWSPASTETANDRADMITSCIRAALATQHSTSGGSSDTDVNAFAVIPWPSRPPAVSTVTPVANCAITSRCEACLDNRCVGGRGNLAIGRWPPAEPLSATSSSRGQHGRVRRVRSERGTQLLGNPGRDGVRVRAAHARDPLPAAGDQDLAVLVQVHVVEAELDLGLGQLLEPHPDGQLVERGDLGEELTLDLQREQLQVVANLR